MRVHLEGVFKRWSPFDPWVLQDASLGLEAASLTCVEGANGCGKTTLLQLLAGVTAVTRGSVRRPRRVAYVPEGQPESVPFSGAEYLEHFGRIWGTGRAGVQRGVGLCERLQLEPGLDAAIDSLSKGNRQKILLAQALAAPADLLVLDEPFGGLDPAAAGELADLLDEARSEGATVVVSTHEPRRVKRRDMAVTISRSKLQTLEPDAVPSRGPTPRERRVLLSARRSDASLDWLERFPSATVIDVVANTCRLTVNSVQSDALLCCAIDDGWTVVSVGTSPVSHQGEN